ncbi:MAG: PH domain-containing protein [Phycisphaeraceae bacterium]|nr:PH domain-containing protein [Phycisphaeraceae bacterium]
MITVTCDKCERLLSVEDSLAGSKIACPHCGDINVIPKRPSAPDSRETAPRPSVDRAAAAGYPPDSGPEQRVRLIRPAVIRAHPVAIVGLWTLVLAGLVGAIYLGLVKGSTTWLVASLVACLGALGALGVWKVLSLSETMEITTKRSVLRRGLLSKATTEVVHDDIRNLQISQTFLQRVLKVGTIGISSAGQDAVEIVMRDAPNPQEIRKIIDLYRPL